METQDATLNLSQAIGRRLQAERKRLGLTQAQFAAALGVSRLTVLGYEAGRASPDLERLIGAELESPLDITFLSTGRRSAGSDQSWSLLHASLDVVRSRLRQHGLEMSAEEEADLLRELFLKFRADMREGNR